MALEEDDFIKMGAYVQEHLSEWLSEISFTKPLPIYEVELLERIPRVEKELKNQRDLMKQGFEMINKDFEAVDMRLEQIEKRLFQFMIWSFSFTTTSAGIIIAVQKLT